MNSDAVFNRCIAARQWQNAAAIRGCSIDAIRGQFDKTYHREAPVVVKSPVVDDAPLSPSRVHASQPNPNKPASREWARAVRSRIAVQGMTLTAFAPTVGYNHKTLQCALSPQGHCSPTLRERVEAGLMALEGPSLRSAAE